MKLAAQFGAAGVVLASGIRVEIVENGVAATALGLLWLVAMTNAFNLLDNMDGLAGSLAVVAAVFFAIDAVVDPRRRSPARGLARARARRGRLPPVQLPSSASRPPCSWATPAAR